MTVFGNRLSWKSIPSIPSIRPRGIAGRTVIAGIVVIKLDGLWTFIPK